MSDLTDKEFYEICDLLRFKYTWSNPDCLKGIKDIIKATKDNMRSELANGVKTRTEPALPIQRVNYCACSPDETTGNTKIKCCNICSKPLKSENWRCG